MGSTLQVLISYAVFLHKGDETLQVAILGLVGYQSILQTCNFQIPRCRQTPMTKAYRGVYDQIWVTSESEGECSGQAIQSWVFGGRATRLRSNLDTGNLEQ